MHSDILKMSYELSIKMKCLTPLRLGDVKNFLIPPRALVVIVFLIIYVIPCTVYTSFMKVDVTCSAHPVAHCGHVLACTQCRQHDKGREQHRNNIAS